MQTPVNIGKLLGEEHDCRHGFQRTIHVNDRGKQMADKPYSIRLPEDLVNRICERYPDFLDKEKKGAKKTDILKELIELGLGSDPSQVLAHEIAGLKEKFRDQQSELEDVKRNLSTVLQLLLRNATSFSPDKVEETLAELKLSGKLV